METTEKMGLKVTTTNTFPNDDVQDTIVEYGENFKKIEKHLTEATTSPDLLSAGQLFEKGKILWNKDPKVGEHVGWVNTRQGYHAPLWVAKKQYNVGEKVRATPDNGNVYECVTTGKSMGVSPTFLIGNGVEFYDANGNTWRPNYNYQVNDVVFATNGSKIFYYICETAGFTDITEPSWSSIPSGSTLTDGSAVWRKEATIKWKQVAISSNFRPFGRIE